MPRGACAQGDEEREEVRRRDDLREAVVISREVLREQAGRLEHGRHHDRRDREREPGGERRGGAQREHPRRLDDRHAESGDRTELRPDDHRADDQDRGVEVDPDRSDQRREHHEGQERDRQRRALHRVLLDLLPDDRVGRLAAGELLGALAALGDLRIDRLQRDRPVLADPEVAQIRHDHARLLTRNVAQDHVAVRPARRPFEHDDVADRFRLVEQLQRAPRPVGLGHDPQVHHDEHLPAGRGRTSPQTEPPRAARAIRQSHLHSVRRPR